MNRATYEKAKFYSRARAFRTARRSIYVDGIFVDGWIGVLRGKCVVYDSSVKIFPTEDAAREDARAFWNMCCEMLDRHEEETEGGN